MALSNISQILGIQRTNDSATVKVAYNHNGALKRLLVGEQTPIVQDWVTAGGKIQDYVEPTVLHNHPTPTVSG